MLFPVSLQKNKQTKKKWVGKKAQFYFSHKKVINLFSNKLIWVVEKEIIIQHVIANVYCFKSIKKQQYETILPKKKTVACFFCVFS